MVPKAKVPILKVKTHSMAHTVMSPQMELQTEKEGLQGCCGREREMRLNKKVALMILTNIEFNGKQFKRQHQGQYGNINTPGGMFNNKYNFQLTPQLWEEKVWRPEQKAKFQRSKATIQASNK